MNTKETESSLERSLPDGPSPLAADDAASRAERAVALSVIIPAYNEEESLGFLYDRLVESLDPLGISYEVILVDDGSSDRTFEQLAELAAADPRIRVIKLRRNYGQTPAMVAGIDHAKGRILVTMDADLQNDPADIGMLLEKLEEGHDMVVGWRIKRQDKWLSRKLPSIVANKLIAKVTGVNIRDNGCTLKAFRADLIKRVPLYSEMHRFIPAMSSTLGCSVAEVGVRHHARQHGTSKYGLSRIYRVVFDLIVIKTLLTFAQRPTAYLTGTAVGAGLLSLAGLSAALYAALAMPEASAVVYMSSSILLGSLALFLGLTSIIAATVHHANAEVTRARIGEWSGW
ncbi:MAG: glycosyltransferase family 2 protein [Alphaproteobacteria bacterium]|nr:glycosyltransferase family 2 protein [Alphaproteobacteria bacterium]